MAIRIRLIAAGEEEACNAFYNRTHDRQRLLHQWQWEFTNNTYRTVSSTCPFAVVVDDTAIVGTQALIPIRMIDSNGVFWTAKSEETMVDSNYRGKQLFEKAYGLMFQYAREHRFRWIWGFTPAVKAFERLGFTVPGATGQLLLPFSSRSVAALMEKTNSQSSKGMKRALTLLAARSACVAARAISESQLALARMTNKQVCRIETMTACDKDVGLVCKRFVEQWGGVTIFRDQDYMTWRLFSNPYYRCIVKGAYQGTTLVGWVAYSIGDDGMGYVVDIIAAPEIHDPNAARQIVAQLLLAAIDGVRKMGATCFRGWHVNRHPFNQLVSETARKLGFYTIGRGHAVVIFQCDKDAVKDSVIQFDDWYVTRIYTEGVFG